MFFHILPSKQAQSRELGRNLWIPTATLRIIVRTSSTVTKITGMQQASRGQDLQPSSHLDTNGYKWTYPQFFVIYVP